MKIKLVQKANPTDRTKVKYYANAVNAGKKDLNAIAKSISGRSSLTRLAKTTPTATMPTATRSM